MSEKVRINKQILASEVRVVGADGANLDVMKTEDAVKQALEQGLDLIEISPKAVPPVAKIMDYGKFQYDLKKKQKDIKAKAHVTETKTVQVKIGTAENELKFKAGRTSEWLKEGHRVKIDLFLWGRYKYMELSFLKQRLVRFLLLITEGYKVADEIKRSPKGLTIIVEHDKSGKQPEFEVPVKVEEGNKVNKLNKE